MVRSAIARTNSPSHHRSAAGGDSAGLASGFLPISVCVAARRSRTPRGRRGRLAISPRPTRRLRVAFGGLGVGDPSRACYRLRSRVARSSLLFWARRLGTFEHPAKSERACFGAIAVKPHRALPARESTRLAGAYSAEFWH